MMEAMETVCVVFTESKGTNAGSRILTEAKNVIHPPMQNRLPLSHSISEGSRKLPPKKAKFQSRIHPKSGRLKRPITIDTFFKR